MDYDDPPCRHLLRVNEEVLAGVRRAFNPSPRKQKIRKVEEETKQPDLWEEY